MNPEVMMHPKQLSTIIYLAQDKWADSSQSGRFAHLMGGRFVQPGTFWPSCPGMSTQMRDRRGHERAKCLSSLACSAAGWPGFSLWLMMMPWQKSLDPHDKIRWQRWHWMGQHGKRAILWRQPQYLVGGINPLLSGLSKYRLWWSTRQVIASAQCMYNDCITHPSWNCVALIQPLMDGLSSNSIGY